MRTSTSHFYRPPWRTLHLTLLAALCFALVSSVSLSGCASSGPAFSAPASRPKPPLQTSLQGVTLETDADPEVVASLLAEVSSPVTVRISLEPDQPIEDYTPTIQALSGRANIMVQLVDSATLADISVEEARLWAEEAVAAFGDQVDIHCCRID
ncbi:MAG: hypothetical protein CSA82_03315, partial [Actinobacteria bacterium]